MNALVRNALYILICVTLIHVVVAPMLPRTEVVPRILADTAVFFAVYPIFTRIVPAAPSV
jgi:hypothetical protein